MSRFNKSLVVYKRSALYLGGCIGFALLFGLASGWVGRKNLFGHDSN